MLSSTEDVRRLFQNAAQIIVNPELKDGVVVGADARKAVDYDACVYLAIEFPPIDAPRLPTTRVDALPQFLLQGPFKGAPALHGVAFYIGIGFITVREVSTTRYSYEITAVNGDGIDERLAFLMAARDLFFNDAQLEKD